MRNLLSIAITSVLLYLAIISPANAQSPNIPNFQDPNVRLARPPNIVINRLRFLTTTDFPPFNFIDRKKRLGGFHIDLAREICEELKILQLCQIQALPWDQLETAMKNGEGDAVIAGLAISEKSRELYSFSTPFLQIPARFVASTKTSFREPMFKNMFKKKTGVISGSAHAKYFKSVFQGREMVEFDNSKKAKSALIAGKIDLLFSDAVSLSFWLTSKDANNCCKFVGEPYLSREYFGNGLTIAVPKQNAELVMAINFALAKVNESGKFRELYLRYFPLSLY